MAEKPAIEWVIPETPPVNVPAVRAYQGLRLDDPTQPQAIYGAYCPTCHPGKDRLLKATLDAFSGKSFWSMQLSNSAELIWLNRPGRIICKCGTHLNLTHSDSEK